MNKKKAITLLEELISEGEEIKGIVIDSDEKFIIWKRNVEIFIKKAFPNENYDEEFSNIYFRNDYFSSCSNGITNAISQLKSMINEIETYWDDKDKIKYNISITINIILSAYSIIISFLYFFNIYNLYINLGITLSSILFILKQYGFLITITNSIIKFLNNIFKRKQNNV